MTIERELYDLIDIVELDLPEKIKEMRYKKKLGEFYVKLIEVQPVPFYQQITPHHIDYLDDLLSVEQSFDDKDYSKVLFQVKSLILDKEGYILQGRIYYNLLTMFVRHLKDTITEFIDPIQIQLNSIKETSIFEARLNKKWKKDFKERFSKSLIPINEDKKQVEYDRFMEIMKKWQVDNDRNYQGILDIVFDFLKKDIKTDPLTLVLFYDDLEGQYQVMKISREKEFPYKDFALFKTDGINYYFPDKTIFRQVKDFRCAMLITILQNNR